MKQSKKSLFLRLGLGVAVAIVAAAASCGGNQKTSGFGPPGSSSGGGSSDDGGDGLSSGYCFSCNGTSSGLGNLNADGGTAGPPTTPPSSMLSIDDCAGQPNAAQLEAGGAVASGMKWLYPYDQTIFPGGLLAPVLQWAPQSGGADGVYLHMKSSLFEYKGCFGKNMLMQLTPPANAWSGAWAQTNGPNDPVTVQLTTIAGGVVSGPITETWRFALGNLKGTVYYNTYHSQIAAETANLGDGGQNGAVMTIKPGQSSPTALLAILGSAYPIPTGPCISCHSLSADGSMIVAQKHFYPGGLTSPGSMSFDLKSGLPNPTNPTPLSSTMNDDWGFSAVYPDGSRLLTAGEPASSTSISALFPVANTNNPAMIGPKNNVMYSTQPGGDGGAVTIPFTGLADHTAMMPMFSPDGTKIVFNDVTNHGGHGLVVQDFDAATNTFSNPVVIYNDANGNYAGWPFFTPDMKYVVFAMGPSSNYSSIPPASFSGVGPVQASASDVTSSDLYVVCLRSPGTAHALNLANGFCNSTGPQPWGCSTGSYLPFGSRDEHLDFYPTGSPVASGGYFWVFFTSRRQYGNLMVDTTNNNAVPDPVFHAETKKIWVTALDIDGAESECATDSSHPAFVLPGQELSSGNIRAFAALNPCVQNGSSCTAGVDCCGGYCDNGTCGPPPSCSTVDNKCTTASDCCTVDSGGQTLQCLGGYCAIPTPPQ